MIRILFKFSCDRMVVIVDGEWKTKKRVVETIAAATAPPEATDAAGREKE